MKLSHYFLPTLRQAPSDADTISTKLMQRAGLIRKVTGGLYEWLPFGLRALKNVEQIVREEMNAVNGQEVWLPIVHPKNLWEETGRWNQYGKELLRFKDRKDAEFCLAPTAEEVITDLVRNEISSYRQLPVFLYQFGTKFRDEIRPRFGVMRSREFYMKDGYSFHADEKDAENFYQKAFTAYQNIFKRCGLKFRPVEAETGAIGGSFSHEFMVLAETGENEIAYCSCGYAANSERAECAPPSPPPPEPSQPLQEVHTPNAWTVEDVAKLLKAAKEKFLKTLFYMADGKPIVALVRGDHELNENKLMRHLGSKKLEKATDKEYEQIAGCPVGFAGPVGLDGRASLLADLAVQTVFNGISGANKKDYHLKNINRDRDYRPAQFVDLHVAAPGDRCPRCQKPFQFCRGIEVGHTFKLGTKYSQSMKATYLDAEQHSKPFIMGCYGIGVSRVVAAAIEQGNDENGIIWPASIAPFQVQLIPIESEDSKIKEAVEKLYQGLQKRNISVLLDDRSERAGVKFKDADLIGTPLRITVSSKTIEKDSVELKRRSSKELQMIPLNQCPDFVDTLLHEMLK